MCGVRCMIPMKSSIQYHLAQMGSASVLINVTHQRTGLYRSSLKKSIDEKVIKMHNTVILNRLFSLAIFSVSQSRRRLHVLIVNITINHAIAIIKILIIIYFDICMYVCVCVYVCMLNNRLLPIRLYRSRGLSVTSDPSP